MVKGRPIDKLDYKHMMSMILYLKYNAPCRRTNIYHDVSNCYSSPTKISSLIDMGFVEEMGDSFLKLTDSGLVLAGHLEEIESLLDMESNI